MANQIIIDIGAVANDGTGDPLRTAFNYVNNNFSNVWNTGLPDSNISFSGTRILTVNTNGNLILAPNGTGKVVANVDIIPNANITHSLGSPTRYWNTVYTRDLEATGQITFGGDLYVNGNLTVEGDTIQLGNIVTDTKTIQLANTAVTANAANGSGITVGANDNIATMLYSSSGNVWAMNIGISAVGNITAPYFIGNGSQLTGITVVAGSNTQVQFNDGGVLGADADFYYNKTTNTLVVNGNLNEHSIELGSQGFTELNANVIAQITGNANSYTQINFQNINSGSRATTDYIATAAFGTDSTFYVDMGIASNSYDNTNPNNSLGNALYPQDSYLYSQGGNTYGGSGGNLVVGSNEPGGVVRLIADGSFTSNIVATFSNVGIDVKGNIVPVASNTYSLGNSTNQWADLWVSNSTIYMNSVPITLGVGNILTVGGNAVLQNDSNTSITTTGNISAANLVVTGGSLSWPNASIVQTSTEDFSITGDGQVTVRSLDGTYQWTFGPDGNLAIPGSIIGTATINIDNRATGNSADIQLYSADDITLQARDRSAGSTSEGGDISIFAGDSAEDGDTSGGDITIFAGDGGAANVDFGGSGGFITIQSGQGGAASTEVGGQNANNGGALTLRAGDAGSNMGNAARGANGGTVTIRGGTSTGNLDVGGSITLTTGFGGPNAAAGSVTIDIPASDQGLGGEWLFGGTGNTLTTPADAVISSADGNLRIGSSLNTVLNADPYNWTFNNDGNLVTAPISIPSEGPTGEAQSLRGTRRLIGGYESTYAYSQILDNNSGSTVAWVATDSNTRSARITFQITYTDVSFGFQAREILTVDVVQDTVAGTAYFSVSGRVGTNGYAPGVVSASLNSSVITINIVPDGIYYYGLAVYDAVEFKGPLD